MIPIWFFIGLLLLIYGVLILGAGIWDVFSPPVPAVVLNKLHAGVWWGALLVGIGVVYCVKFRPGTEKRG
ncbi:MAG: hypothetical protein ABSH45_11065 [Bryobacteraceae bacterium]|jgi:Na+/H+ antiporter NhaD/arsenite permease-like protein